MKASVTVALLSVMAAGLATGCSTPAPKVVESSCQKGTVGDLQGLFRVLLFDDGSIEVLRDQTDGDQVTC